MDFDYLLETRIKNGLYQKRAFAALSLVDFVDGIEGAFLGIMVSIIANEWGLDKYQVIMLASVY